MADTEKLDIPLIAADQSQKHVTHNEALQMLDQIVQQNVINRTRTFPPASPSEGDSYIIAATATGDWVGREDEIASYVNGAWLYFPPNEGWFAYDNATAAHYAYIGAEWVDFVSYVTNSKFGWENHQDVTTATTPLALTLADTWYDVPNDGAGALTIHTAPPQITGVGPLWDDTAGEFDFTSLSVYDEVRFRFDVEVTTSGVNREIDCRLVFGPSFGFSNIFSDLTFKSAGTHQIFREFSFAMFNTDTLNNPAKFQMRSDGTGDTVKVNGWKISVHRV